MAEDIPPSKKIRLDSTASEGSEVLSQFLNDLDNIPDLSSLDGLAGNEASGLLNSTTANPQQQQQNTPNNTSSVPNSLTPTPNHQGSNVSPSVTPPVANQVPAPYSGTPPQTQQPPSVNTTPNATINMYGNSPRGGDINSSMYAGFNASGNVRSPQPMAVSTLADPTPVLPSVSSTPAHGIGSMAPSHSIQNFDPMTRTTAPMMTNSPGGVSTNVQQFGMRRESPMHPGARVAMATGYQGGHPGVPSAMHGGMGGHIRIQHGGGMPIGRGGMPHHVGMEGGRPGMVMQMSPQGMHPRNPHGYNPHGYNPHVNPAGTRMIPNPMHPGHGMNPGIRRPLHVNPNSQPGLRMINPAMMQHPSRPSGHHMYMPSAGQAQMSPNRPTFPGNHEQQQPSHLQPNNSGTFGQSPALPPGNPTAPSPGPPSMPSHQPAQNDHSFNSGQTPNQGSPHGSGPIGVAVSQPPPSHQQSSALATAGGSPSLPGRPPVPPGGINSTVDENLNLSQNPQQPQGQPHSVNSPASSLTQALGDPRIPTPPPPGSNNSIQNFFPGGGNKLPPGPGGPPNQTSDPEKRKQIQQQLVLLLHAHKCQRRERDQQASGDYRPCTLPHCKTMKSVLNHMTECQAGRTCTFAHCATSRQIINHWRNCTRADCPVCLPLKHPAQQPSKQPSMGQPHDITGAGIMSASGPLLDISGGGFLPTHGGMGPNPGVSMVHSKHMMHPHAGGGASYSGGFGYNPGVAPNLGGPQSSFPLPIPQIVSNPTQAWHSLVNPDLRQHLVRKLVEAIYPVHDPTALRDARVKSLIQYAMKVEKVMFEAAQSREEYYKLLAQKIYLIRKELEDRKRNKSRGQMPMMNGGDPGAHQGGYPPGGAMPGQYSLPPTPNSNMTNPSVPGNPSPHPNSDLPPGFPPTPIQSIDTKEPGIKMVSPTGLSNANSSDPSAQISIPSLPSSVKSEIKSELLSPTFPPGSITAPPLLQQQQIKTELNTNIGSVPPLPLDTSIPSVKTPGGTGVPSVKPPNSNKRRESFSEMPPSAKPATPSITMETNTPRSPAVGSSWIKANPTLRKVFSTEELEAALRPVFNEVWMQDIESLPFRNPVDPVQLEIPDYFLVIKHPMDLTTISSKLSSGDYKSGWEFCFDMWLMFDNAWAYNKKTSRVYKYSSKLAEVFEQHINGAMAQLGYCCGMRYTYHPQVLYCYGKPLCTIPRDSPYYGCQNRYIYCPKCFSEIQGDTVTVGDDPLSATRLPKAQFKEMKNNAVDREPFVECVHCGRQMHQICALHHDQIWPGGFQCDNCLSALGKRKKENKFVPRRLPVTKLGSYLEERVNSILLQENSGAGRVTIRVVSSSDKTLDTRPLMRDRFAGDFPAQFPYRTKAMFVFEEIDGVDVCFFGMHVQEYGSDCLAPNTRRVYISYLDSVHFFTPRFYRTKVYHELLIGYLDFCKANGFMTAHIWACPPSEGDDYIFHCHPLEQKIPKPKRLSDWYRKMLDTAKDMKVVCDYKDVFKHCTDEQINLVTELPYFEGDFWPNVLEEFIKELDQEAREREASELACEGPKKAGKRGTNKKGSKKASGARNKSSKKGSTTLGGDDLSSKVYQTMEKHKDVFFTVLLHPPTSDSSPLPGTTDPDQLITCDLMDGRDAFLTMSRERHWEFSSLRRAKFSSISMVYELHTQSEDKFMYNCNNCHLDVVARYHCTECDDFDLCIKCYKEVAHNHQMVKLGLDIDDPQSNEAKQLDPQKARQASIEKCIRALIHATQCRDPHCKQPSCIKMKKVLTHTRECKLMLARKWNQCTICKQFVLLCISHAKNCTDDACRVPLCATIKKNLKEQRKQRTVETNRFAQQRVARMASMLTNSSSTPTGGNVSSPQQSSSTHVSPQNSSGKNPNPAVPSPAAPRSVGGKGGPRTPGTPGGGKGRMMANPSGQVMGGGGAPPPGMAQAGKPEPNTLSVPPNVTVPPQPSRMDGELQIQVKKVSTPSAEQLVAMFRDPNQREIAQHYINNNPELRPRVQMILNSLRGNPQNMMSYHNPGAGNQVFNPHVRPGGMQYASNYGHPHSQMMRYPANHPQYAIHNQSRMAPGNYPPQRTPYQNTAQQSHPTLQRMLTSGTGANQQQQQYASQQQQQHSYNPQMSSHHLGPPPQYPSSMGQHPPMPQTAGYPQVLGQQNRPVPDPSHMPQQIQYSSGAANQSMGMDPIAMQDNFMYQQQTQPHQYALNSSNSNNNNGYSQGDVFSALTPQDRLSKFVENL